MVTSGVLFRSDLCFSWSSKKATVEGSVKLWWFGWCWRWWVYSLSDGPQPQTVLGHLAVSEAYRLQLVHGEQLLPGVNDLTLDEAQTH